MLHDSPCYTLTGKTVLVVDDNAHMRRLIGTLLSVTGSPHVKEAVSARSALERLNDTPVDMLICDWRIGDMTGLEVIKSVRQGDLAASPDLPIIAVSAYSNRDLAQAMYTAGANAVMTKPLGISTFLSIVRNISHSPASFRDAGTWFGPESGCGPRVRALP